MVQGFLLHKKSEPWVGFAERTTDWDTTLIGTDVLGEKLQEIWISSDLVD